MHRALATSVAVLALTLASQAHAQQRAGVVTSLEGHVTVSRPSSSRPAPLRFKDDVFVRDRITTGSESIARILLGGRAVVTVREHSMVTLTESPGVATVDVATGRVAVAVAREKMRAGDVVEVKTPNAVAGIRGTVIVAEVFGPTHSVITVLKGTIDVARIEAGHLVGATMLVDALQRVNVVGRSPIGAPQPIPADAARRLGQEFRLAPPRQMPPAAAAAVRAGEVARATKDLAAPSRSVAVDRHVRTNAPDDDQDDVIQENRDAPGREKWQRIRDVDSGPKGRTAPFETTPAGKNASRPVDPVYNTSRSVDPVYSVPDVAKPVDKSGRGNRGRDR